MNKLSLRAIVNLVLITFLVFITIPWSYAQNLSFQNIHSLRQSTTIIAQAPTETQEDNGEKTEESKELEEVEPAPVISTVIAIICWLLLNRTLPRLFKKITTWQKQRINSVRFQGLQFLSSRQIGNLVSFIFRIIRYFLIALLLYIYIPFL